MIVQVMFLVLLALLAVWVLRKIAKARRRSRRLGVRHKIRAETRRVETPPGEEARPRLEPRLTRWPKEIRTGSGKEPV